MIKELREIEKEYIQHDPLTENTMDNEDAINISLFMEEVIKTFVEFDKQLKEVEKQADINWASLEYVYDCFEKYPVRFKTDGVDNIGEK